MHAQTPRTPPALSLRDVQFGYPIRLGLARKPVLRGVSLELAGGEALGLAGPNGSGKSTLLRLLAGLDAPTGGVVQILGGSPGRAAARARIGYLSEDARFPRELSLRGALRLFGTLGGLSRREAAQRADDLLERVGLAHAARTSTARCSRGMLRRFGLAQAWLHAPDVILLDEPTAGLDALGFEVLAGLLAEARARGAAVLLASHVLSDLTEHCDTVAVLCDGRVVEHGPPRLVFASASLTEIYRRHAGAHAP